MADTLFDAGYYRRYYETPRTSVVTKSAARAEVAFVLAFCGHIGLSVRRFADVGAGTGWWSREFKRQYRHPCEIETFDSSEAAASRYGHKRVSAEKLAGRAADLVVCRDVLRYMDNTNAAIATQKLAAKCRGVLYLHVITSEDDIDEDASDMSGHFRSVRWYQRELRKAGFINAGMGLFVSRRLRTFDPFAIELP